MARTSARRCCSTGSPTGGGSRPAPTRRWWSSGSNPSGASTSRSGCRPSASRCAWSWPSAGRRAPPSPRPPPRSSRHRSERHGSRSRAWRRIAAASAALGFLFLPVGWAVALGLAVGGALLAGLRPGVLAPVVLALAGLWVLTLQARYAIIPGYEWALETARVHPVAMAATVALLVDVLTVRWWRPPDPKEPR